MRATTRGNGTEGDDITRNALTIGLPRKLAGGNHPETIEIRGEIFIEIENSIVSIRLVKLKASFTLILVT